MPKQKIREAMGGFAALPTEDPEVLGCSIEEGAAKQSGRDLNEDLAVRRGRRVMMRIGQNGNEEVRVSQRVSCCSWSIHLMLTLAFCVMAHLLWQQSRQIGLLDRRLEASEELLLMHRLAGVETSAPGRAYLELSKDCMRHENTARLKKVTGVNLQACRKNCDDDMNCKGFSFRFRKNVATCITRKEGCRDIAPGPCDYSKGWCSFRLVDGYRPKSCPQDMPPSDPWWAQYARLSKQHPVCGKMSAASGDGSALSKCPEMSITNRKRVHALRQVLNATHKILTHLGVRYAVNSGTSIGHERCKDVIPWDGDNDIVVESDDMEKLASVFKDRNLKDARRFVGMAFLGFSEMMYTEVRGCIGWRVVHMPTGIYTDMFPLKSSTSGGKSFVKYLYHLGSTKCSPSEFRQNRLFDKDESCVWRKCVQTPAEWFWPALPCTIGGVDTYCPNDADKYLTRLYNNYLQGSHPVRDLI